MGAGEQVKTGCMRTGRCQGAGKPCVSWAGGWWVSESPLQCLGRKPANRDLYKEFGGVHNLFCFHYEISSGVFEASGFLLKNTKEVLFLSKSVQRTADILTVHLQMLNLSSVAKECSHGAGVKADVPEGCRSCTGRCLLQKGNELGWREVCRRYSGTASIHLPIFVLCVQISRQP